MELAGSAKGTSMGDRREPKGSGKQGQKRPPRRYQGMDYWTKPRPGFGDPKARVLIVGLAPATHRGN